MKYHRREKHVAAYDPRDSERVLWVNVVLQAIRDATDTKNTRQPEAERQEARAWFDAGNPSFREVCFLAGMDPKHVHAQATEAIARFDAGRGLVPDFGALAGTGGGRTAQETPEIDFSKTPEDSR